jgi:endonuclease YncB( thermonuclease family)
VVISQSLRPALSASCFAASRNDTLMKPLLVPLSAAVAVLAGGVFLAGSADAVTTARIVRWKDGDTVVTSRGTVRIIGIDTPERGRCGYVAATRHAKRVAPAGSSVRLMDPRSVKHPDRYGRKLRYLQTRSGRNVGLSRIRDRARARYDSRDGYQYHPRQASYHGGRQRPHRLPLHHGEHQ